MVRNFYIHKYLFTPKYSLKTLKLMYCKAASKYLQVILFQKAKSLKFQEFYVCIYIYIYIYIYMTGGCTIHGNVILGTCAI